jgi:lysophospholipid acyltransferase (LPLAT)-like uncharacterized protein
MADPRPQPEARRPRAGGIVVPHEPKWHQRWAAALAYGLIRGVAATLRFRLRDESGVLAAGNLPEPVIFCIWHNRLALCLMLYRRYVLRQHPRRRMAAIVSASRDGALLARILELFRVQPVRGSSSRRGPQALRELTAWGERGYDLAVTPDGPRGPCYVVQEGVVAAAQLTGLPILPVAYHLPWKKRLRSWDRFQIPIPFSRCDVRIGELFHIPREADDAEREVLRQRLEDRMRALTQD